MFFDDYIYTPIDNVEFSLKPQGQRGDKEKRLSLWYEIKDTSNIYKLKKDNSTVWFER
jgi:hypothetical protein